MNDRDDAITKDKIVDAIDQEFSEFDEKNSDSERNSMRKRRAEIESNPALSPQNPDAARYLELYIDKYISDSPAPLPPPEQSVELEL